MNKNRAPIDAGNIDASQFEIWIELEEYADVPDYDEEEFCNIGIIFCNGDRIGLNVWSEKFFQSEIEHRPLDERGILPLPDLVIHKLEPTAIRAAVTRLVTRDKWLVGRGFPVWDDEISELDDMG